MLTVKHIYWFAYFNESEPSVRYRAKYPLEILFQKSGITYNLITPSYKPTKIFRFIKIYCSILFNRKPDSYIVFEKIRTQRIYATFLKILVKIHPKNTIYDIDDADYLKFAPVTINFFLKNCDKCIVGSSALAQYASGFNPHVFTITSPVINHPYSKKKRNGEFTIGWVGYYNAHRQSLIQLLIPAIQKINFQVKLVLMGVTKVEHIKEIQDYFHGYPHVNLVMPQSINWLDEFAIYKEISNFDIGVAPLLDTEINRAKSAFKLKQYLSCGVPVLGSDIGENSAFLKHSVNGYICNEPDEYIHYIDYIVNMQEADYLQLSVNAMDTVKSFSMEKYCAELLEVISV